VLAAAALPRNRQRRLCYLGLTPGASESAASGAAESAATCSLLAHTRKPEVVSKAGGFAYLGGMGKAGDTALTEGIYSPSRVNWTRTGAFATNSCLSLPVSVVFGTKNELKSSRIRTWSAGGNRIDEVFTRIS